MADYFQGGIFESLWNSAKRDGFQGMTISGAFAPVTCSSTMADSYSGSGTFNWAAIEIDDGKTGSTDEPASSASGSTTTFQDTQNTQFPNHIPNFNPSPYSMDWAQALISNTGRDETSFHSILQEDNNWRPTLLPEPSILSSNQDINTFPLKPASCGYPSSLYESVDSQIKGSIYDTWPMNTQQSMTGYPGRPSDLPHPSWTISAAPAQRFEQKSNSSNQTMQSNKKSVRDSSSSSTKKGSGRCVESPQKKPRIDMPSPLPTFKVRKEKLGDRITALQQLVSPFGKTDTASVLHETIDYIKFLHDQVSVLSNPYLNNMQYQQNQDNSSDGDGPKQDLRSRGLCLVPITSTFPVVSENSVDAWTSTFGGVYSNRRAKTSFFAMLQEDLSSRPFFRQEASIYSDQVQPIEENSMVNHFKDTSESLLENHHLSTDIEVNCGINNLPLHLGTYGCPSMTQQGQLKLISKSQQSVYDSQSVNYRSKAMVIGQA